VYFSVSKGFGAFILIGGLIYIWIMMANQRKEVEIKRLEEIGLEKPAFPEFYMAWKDLKNKENLRKGLNTTKVLATIVLGVVTAGVIQGLRDVNKE
jgi:hypothetical protein